MSDYLCEELIVEIFTRLPSKSLLRFRLLSKSLRSCIDSSGFIRMHNSRSPQRLVIKHQVKDTNIQENGEDIIYTLHAVDQLPLCPIRGYIGITTAKFPQKNVLIVGSCNGIFCLFDYKRGIINLWNPSIRRQLTLPNFPRVCFYKLQIGFGFDPITDDIKIVSVPIHGGNVESPIVYTMKTHNWCPVASPMPLYSKALTSACFVNGILHWVVCDDVNLHYIMIFDLSTHVFDMIALPKPSWKIEQLTTIQNSLAVICRDLNDSWIWVRRNDSWSVVFKWEPNRSEESLMKVLELTNNGDFLLDTVWEGIQVYNPKIEARSRLVNFNGASFMFDMDMYVESLHLLDTGTPCKVRQPSFIAGKKRKRSLLDLSRDHQITIEYLDS